MPVPSTLIAATVVLAIAAGCAGDPGGAAPTASATATASAPAPATASATPTVPTSASTPANPAVAPTPTPNTPVAPPPPPAECAPVVVLGARGSGQPPGLGAEVAEVVASLQTTGTPVTAEAVDYAASPIADALLAPELFVTSVLTGARALRAQTAALLERCPGARVVWAGYSQGALVVRAAIDNAPDPATEGVGGVVLLADPSRAPLDPVNRGSAPPEVGGPQSADPSAVAGPVSAAWAPLTTSWCLAGDPFCDGSTTDTFGGILIHTQGYREQGITTQAAAEAATLLGLG